METNGDYMDVPEYVQGNLDAYECAKCHSLFGFDCICDEGQSDEGFWPCEHCSMDDGTHLDGCPHSYQIES